jgi:hypothetical protein
MTRPDYNQEQVEARKKGYLVIGVSIFSIIIFIIWLLGLRFSFQSDAFTIPVENAAVWQEELDESMSYFQDNLNSLNQANESKEIEVEGKLFLENMTENLSEKNKEIGIVQKDAQELEIIKIESDKLLKNLESKINNNVSCPVFINCMPGPDRTGPCSVPPGCEDITQIAY